MAVTFSLPLSLCAADDWFPFVLPWDDAKPGLTDLSSWNEKPAGRDGFVTVKDGHLFAGDRRLRIFGVNCCFGANFPTKEAAPKIAARMAKLGINCVRFHHMDSQGAPAGIFASDGITLDPDRLDRLDFFIAQLKANGIYANLNLHVSRDHPDRPKTEKEGNPVYDKGVDNFAAGMIARQKEYARALLTHVNPYTGKAYAAEPAVALVEINNENALFQEWNSGGLDGIAAPYRAELGALWTQFLTSRHHPEDQLRAFLSEGAREAGEEMFKQGNSSQRDGGWSIEEHEGARCAVSLTDEAMELSVSGEAKQGWHAQISQGGFKVTEGGNFTLAFRGRASGPEKIQVVLSQAHAPWQVLDSRTVELDREWREIRADLHASMSDDNVRVAISNLARTTPTTFAFANFSLRPGAVIGTLERGTDGNFPAFTRDEVARRPAQVQEEWLRFLWSLEEAYWPGMQRFLKEELGVKSLVIGTQLGWSPFPIQQQLDVLDSHSYWKHPYFPGKAWDMGNWRLENIPMAGVPDGGTLPALALQRVAGKPYICTEYNHPMPNRFDAETFPLICAYAALQDWDGVFAFAYSHRTDDWDSRSATSFFDIDQHPAKLATLPGALALFRRGDVQAARTASYASVSLTEAILQTGRTGPRLGAEFFGVKWSESLIHRVGVRLTDGEDFSAQPEPTGPVYVSDTSELTWDAAQRVVLVNTPRSKAVVGAANGKTFTLGNVAITPASEWSSLQVTAFGSGPIEKAPRLLIAATAATENTGLKWTDAEKTSVGRDWGHAPTIVEGVRAAVQLPATRKWRAWALDPQGQRTTEVPVTKGRLELDPAAKTLWYEVSVE